MAMVVKRFEVHLINLDPTVGTEIQKTRPCLVISPNEMNRPLNTVIIAPMTTVERAYPTRVLCTFQGKTGEIVIDQIRTVDKSRLVKKLGKVDQDTQNEVIKVLQKIFTL